MESGRFGMNNPFYGKRHSEEAKNKNRLAHLGKKQSKETIEKRVATIRERYGGWHLDGFRHSDKSKKLMSKSLMGKVSWNSGKSWSKEVRKKISRSHSNKSLSNSHKKHISEGLVRAYQRGERLNRAKFCAGHFYSKKNNKTYHYRSSYELFAYGLLEQMAEVVAYKPEPFGIEYRKGYDEVGRYIPDIIVTYKNGDKQLIEVKSKRHLNNLKVIRKFKAAKRYCDMMGLEFSVWTEDQVFKKDIREPVRVH